MWIRLHTERTEYLQHYNSYVNTHCVFSGSAENQDKDGLFFVAFGKTDEAIVKAHNLSWKTESDAWAVLFCGEKWHKYLLLALASDWSAVIYDVDYHCLSVVDMRHYVDAGGFGLNGIAD